jgi:hypothetical protein
MSAGAEAALTAAICTSAAASPAVRAVLGEVARVYVEAPPQPIFPYATVAGVQSTPLDASGEAQALHHTVTLHVWARAGGREEAATAISALREALHDQPLAPDGRRVVSVFAVFADVFRADLRTHHGVLRLRIVTEALIP